MSKVIIHECKDYKVDNLITKINEGIDKLGGWDHFVHPGDTVLLKVNLIGPKPSSSGAITHSEFVRALVRILKGLSCVVWIGDSSGGAIAGQAPTAKSMAVAGYEQIAREEGAEIKNFDREGVVKVKDNMYLARPLFDADVIINLPKLKTHSMGIYTGAVKNAFGCIPGLRKAMYHRMAPDAEKFGKVLADIHQELTFNLNIMDGIEAMQGEGPTAGNLYHANKILISADPLALDTVAAKMIGLDMEELLILKASCEIGLGESKLDKIIIDGDYSIIPELPDFQLPILYRTGKRRNFNALIPVIDFFKTIPKIDVKRCKHCNVCVDSCPVGAIMRESKTIDYTKCIECMCCHELCMHKAVVLKRKHWLANIAMKLYRGTYR